MPVDKSAFGAGCVGTDSPIPSTSHHQHWCDALNVRYLEANQRQLMAHASPRIP